MTIDQQIKLAEIAFVCAANFAWPVLILAVLLLFISPTRNFLSSLTEFSLKAAGVEATAKKQQQAEASKLMFSEVESSVRSIIQSEAVISEIRKIANQPNGIKIADEQVSKILSNVADKTVETIRESNFITVDSRPLVGEKGEIWELPYTQFSTVSDFLDNLWFLLQPYGIPSMKYGALWALRDANSGKELKNIGRLWARKTGNNLDTRSLDTIGISPGARLEAFRLASKSSQ